MTARAAGLVVSALLLLGCPRQDEPREFDPKTDRTLQKLIAEQQRQGKSPAPKPKEPEPDPLTQLATTPPAKPETLGIPSGVAADLGPLSLSLLEVQQMQTVGGSRVSLATTDRFLKVSLKAVAGRDFELDLTGASLENGDAKVGLARDAQRAGNGSPLSVHLAGGTDQKLVLFFEAPPEMIRKGLKIILTSPGSRVELPLQ
ncbi:MAG: hypothetical protein ACOZQL_39815 [Myxococcota bacterium]